MSRDANVEALALFLAEHRQAVRPHPGGCSCGARRSLDARPFGVWHRYHVAKAAAAAGIGSAEGLIDEMRVLRARAFGKGKSDV
mgnify:FL=1